LHHEAQTSITSTEPRARSDVTPSGWSLRATVGAVIGGTLEVDGGATYDIHPGAVVGIGAARQWTVASKWFVTGSATLSFSIASTSSASAADEPRFIAGDARGGVMAGRTLGEIWQPYVLGRGFGGPVFWSIAGKDASGTDVHHFQVGAGLSVALPFGLTLVADVSMLGEQAASLGASWRL
jgi:hypothetical protein